MKFLKISNNGEMDVNALILIGASTKEGDNSKIGYFGSGNKYAISTLFRKNIGFRIFSGLNEIKIETKKVEFGGCDFDQIYVNGNQTSLTTRMGPDWELWFAIREFICNAIDESGHEVMVSEDVSGTEGRTNVFVEFNSEVESFYENIGRYIADSRDSIDSVKTFYGSINIMKKGDPSVALYRKGIRVNIEKDKRESLYNYDFEQICINESRIIVFEHEASERIASALAVTKDKDVITNFLRNSRGNNIENRLHWEYVQDRFSESWQEILEGKTVCPMAFLQFGPSEDKSFYVVVQDSLAKKISEELVNVHVIGFNRNGREECEPTAQQKEVFDSALAHLKDIGFEIELCFKFCVFKEKQVMALWDKEKEAVFMSVDFLQDSNTVEETIVEEYLHSLGMDDSSRRMTEHLIRELIDAKHQIKISLPF